MLARAISPLLERFSKLYPILGITGPRQSGKTTISRHKFSHLPYVSLEDLDTRALAQNDARGFLNRYSDGAILDEVQHVPQLFSYLQGMVDSSPQKGRFVLTGSQNFALTENISQSLSGRIGMVTLLPLCLGEIPSYQGINASIFRGGYPALHLLNMNPIDFYPSYIQTYIERDVRQIKNIENLGRFQTFLKLCAGRVGQIVNFSSLAQDAGISHVTARQWLSILEASYLVFFLQPYFNNFNKRLIKMPKMYFYDTGLACNLLGLEKESQLETYYQRGALFENLAILEILKQRLNQGLPPNMYFWRDQTGHEIDLLLDVGGVVHAIEIKASETFQTSQIKGVKDFQKLSPSSRGYLISGGIQGGKFDDVELIPINKLNIEAFL